ncbi:MAG: DUF3859 domain-containing protein [Wenzhouxiangella sp.]
MAGASLYGSFGTELPEDYSPSVAFCPPGLDALPEVHSVALIEAASACAEADQKMDAVTFHIASIVVDEINVTWLYSLGGDDEIRSYRRLFNVLAHEFQQRYPTPDDGLMQAVYEAYPQVFDWALRLERVNPGFLVEVLPPVEEYRQRLGITVAAAYAREASLINAMKDEEFRRLQKELSEAHTDGYQPAIHGLAYRLMNLHETLNKEFLEDFEPNLVLGRITQYGVFEAFGEIEYVPAPDTADGTHIIPDETVFHETSTVIPAELGLSFGFDYEVGGVAPGTEHRFLMRAIHPPMRNPQGEWQTVSTADFGVTAWTGLVDRHLSYRFSEPHQLLPGEWTLQVLYFDEVVVSKTFQVVKPD